MDKIISVSYTHLDVYKRQVRNLGKKSLKEVKDKIYDLGLSFKSFE